MSSQARTLDGLTTGEAARRLGISTPALRGWTRRHGYPPFTRTPGGHRRYDPHDIDALALNLESNGGMVRPAIEEARQAEDVFTVCPHCRKQVDRLLVRTRQVPRFAAR